MAVLAAYRGDEVAPVWLKSPNWPNDRDWHSVMHHLDEKGLRPFDEHTNEVKTVAWENILRTLNRHGGQPMLEWNASRWK